MGSNGRRSNVERQYKWRHLSCGISTTLHRSGQDHNLPRSQRPGEVVRTETSQSRMSEMIGKLNLEQQNFRRTNRRLTIFHKAINGNLALPIGNLQPVLRHTRHLNCKAYNTIHTSEDCYKYSIFPRIIKDWNSLPDKITTIKEPQKFKLVITHLD